MMRASNVIDIFGDLLGSWQKLRDRRVFPFCWHGNFYAIKGPISHPENQKAFLKKFCRLIVFVIILTGR